MRNFHTFASETVTHLSNIRCSGPGAINNWFVLGLLLFLTGCSPEKLLQKAIEKGAKVEIDTVYQDVKVIVPMVKTDTLFSSIPGDTVRITKDRLEIKYVKLAGEKVYIEGACLPDTVKISVPVEVTRTISAGYTRGQLIGTVLGAILFVLLVLYGGYRLLALTRKSA